MGKAIAKFSGSTTAPGGFGSTPGATDQAILPSQWFGLNGSGQFDLAASLATVMQTLANNNYTIPSSLIGQQAVLAANMAANAVTAANGALAAAAVVDSNMVSMSISKLISGTVIFTGNVYMSLGSAYPEIALTYSGMTLYSSAGSTGFPYVQLQGTGALFAAGGSGASVLVSGQALTLYSANGSTSLPYVTLTGSAIGLYSGGNFSATLSSSLFQMLYSTSAAATLTALGQIVQNGNYATYTASTGFWAGYSASPFPIVTAANYTSVVSQMAACTSYMLVGNPGSGFEIDLVSGTNKVLIQTAGITMQYGSGASLLLGYNATLGIYGLTIYSVNGSTSSPYATFTSSALSLYNGSTQAQVTSTGFTVGNWNYSLACMAGMSAGSTGGTISLAGTAGDASLNTYNGTAYLYLGPSSNPGQATLYGDATVAYLSMYPATSYVMIHGLQVLGLRQTGLGNPTGWADSTALTWAQSLYAKLSAHGLIT